MDKRNRSPWPPKKFGRRYPWASLFSQGEFTLVRGRDFDCRVYCMCQMVRNAASVKRHGVRVRIRVDDNRETVMVKVVGVCSS